jgi:hypothetical protein
MSLIVAGRFTTFHAAERAAQALFGRGVLQEDVTLFFVNPPGMHARFSIGGDQSTDPGARRAPLGAAIGAVAGAVVGVAIFAVFSVPVLVSMIAAGVGAYVGSMIGAMSHMRRKGPQQKPKATASHESHAAGVLVAVHVNPENQSEVARMLREAGGVDIERTSGRWQHGRWADFDPLKAPYIMIDPDREMAPRSM